MEASTVQGDLYGEKAGISRGHSSQMPGLMSRIFGKLDILKALQSIAPVVAVQGNMDYGEWTDDLAQTEVVEVGEVLLFVELEGVSL